MIQKLIEPLLTITLRWPNLGQALAIGLQRRLRDTLWKKNAIALFVNKVEIIFRELWSPLRNAVHRKCASESVSITKKLFYLLTQTQCSNKYNGSEEMAQRAASGQKEKPKQTWKSWQICATWDGWQRIDAKTTDGQPRAVEKIYITRQLLNMYLNFNLKFYFFPFCAPSSVTTLLPRLCDRPTTPYQHHCA